MDLSTYKPTDQEVWISKKYRDSGILHACDLEIDRIADIFGIDIRFYSGPPVADWSDEHSVIFLNAYQRLEQRREAFFHELCHPLRHIGYQGWNVPKLFEEMQEEQAGHFQMYAAMPFYMVREYMVELSSEAMLEKLSEEFCLPLAFVHKRLEQIKRRIKVGVSAFGQAYSKSNNPTKWSDETWRVILKLNQQLERKRLMRG